MVKWSDVTKPNPEDPLCPYDAETEALFKRIVGDDLQGDQFKYEKFMKIMAETDGIQTGEKAPIMFDSELLKAT